MHHYKKALVIIFAVILVGCQQTQFRNREKGALGGSAVGAGLGAIIGHATGHTGEGIAIGAGTGAIAGGLLGNEMDKEDDRYAAREDQLSRQDRELQENRRLLDELRSRGLDAYSSTRGVVVNLPNVLFEFDSSRLTAPAERKVRDIADALRNARERNVSVEGHTDSVGSDAYNMRLSRDRAYSVADALAAQGIQKRRMKVTGYGETRPVASNESASGRDKNRRVEVIIENR